MAIKLDHYQTIKNVHWPSGVYRYVEIVSWIIQERDEDDLPFSLNPLIGTPLTNAESGYRYYSGYHTGGPHIELYDGYAGGSLDFDFSAGAFLIEDIYDADGVSNFPGFDVAATGAVSPVLTAPLELPWPDFTWPSGTLLIDMLGTSGPSAGPTQYTVTFWPRTPGAPFDYTPPGSMVTWPGVENYWSGPPWVGNFALRSESGPDNFKQPSASGGPTYQTWKVDPLSNDGANINNGLAAKVPVSFSNVAVNGTPCTVLGYRLVNRGRSIAGEGTKRFLEVYALCRINGTLSPP